MIVLGRLLKAHQFLPVVKLAFANTTFLAPCVDFHPAGFLLLDEFGSLPKHDLTFCFRYFHGLSSDAEPIRFIAK